jgi:hypothetical protein
MVARCAMSISVVRPINVNKWFKWLYKFCKFGTDSDEWTERRNHERGRLEMLELDEVISWPGENLNNNEKVHILISCAIILMLIIYSLLLRQNVESNPGPPNTFFFFFFFAMFHYSTTHQPISKTGIWHDCDFYLHSAVLEAAKE